VGETPHISQDYFCITPHISHITPHAQQDYFCPTTITYLPCRVWWTSLKKEGYCDSVVLTGTSGTGLLRTEYVLILSVLRVPSVLLVYLSLSPPGISGSAITGYSSSGVYQSTSFNAALPRVIQHLIFTTHLYIS
jgi:hypothetical protein